MNQHHENRADEAPNLIGDLFIEIGHVGGIIALLAIAIGAAAMWGIQ